VNALVGNFEVPLTGRELLIALRDGKSVQIGRSFLGKALLLIEQCAEACIDVRTEGDKAFLAPERFRMTETGEKAIANSAISLKVEVNAPRDGNGDAMLDASATKETALCSR
jgi:hypothetical protein